MYYAFNVSRTARLGSSTIYHCFTIATLKFLSHEQYVKSSSGNSTEKIEEKTTFKEYKRALFCKFISLELGFLDNLDKSQ